MNGFEDAKLLLRVADHPETFAARLAELQAASDASAAREQAAVEAEASQAQRVAELDKREAAVRDLELEAHTEKQRLEGVRLELVNFARTVRQGKEQVMVRMARHAGLLDGFIPSMQSLPEDWDAFEASIFGKPADAVFDDDSVNAVTEAVRLPDASASATITRQRRTMRRGSEERI
jgi:hypothetical protein